MLRDAKAAYQEITTDRTTIRLDEKLLKEGPGSLLCVGKRPANTGYAWSFIESLFAALSDSFVADGVQTWVAYPEIEEEPTALIGSTAHAVRLALDLQSPGSVFHFSRFLRSKRVKALYLPGQPPWHAAYAAFRAAGVRWIVSHDHSSGLRTPPRGIKRVLKDLVGYLPGMTVDRAIAVSDFVAERVSEVSRIDRSRVVRIWNGVRLPVLPVSEPVGFRGKFGIPAARPLIFCTSRAVPEKGVQVLLEAFDLLSRRLSETPAKPCLVYVGDGPFFRELERRRKELVHGDDVFFLGEVKGAAELLGAADVCVVPSIWAEAFGLAALEPMARAKPVVASEVGGIPEVVVHGETGMLVPPGDAKALASALEFILSDSPFRERLGWAGRERAQTWFDLSKTLESIREVISQAFS